MATVFEAIGNVELAMCPFASEGKQANTVGVTIIYSHRTQTKTG